MNGWGLCSYGNRGHLLISFYWRPEEFGNPGTAYLFQPRIEYGVPPIVPRNCLELWPEVHPPGVTTRGEDRGSA